jgi:hypothetical protein
LARLVILQPTLDKNLTNFTSVASQLVFPDIIMSPTIAEPNLWNL